MVGGVEQTGSYCCLVALTDEARHVGLHHHIFLCDGLAIDVAIEHVHGIGNTHKAPCRQTLGKGKRQRDATIVVTL